MSSPSATRPGCSSGRLIRKAVASAGKTFCAIRFAETASVVWSARRAFSICPSGLVKTAPGYSDEPGPEGGFESNGGRCGQQIQASANRGDTGPSGVGTFDTVENREREIPRFGLRVDRDREGRGQPR